MKLWKAAIFFILILFLVPTYCIDLCGNISGTLSILGSPYIVTCDISVPSGTTLTIEEGVEIRFNSGTGMTVNGSLDINGTGTNKVILTSNQTTPNRGDWKGITVETNDSVVNIQNAVVKYAGNALSIFPGTAQINISNNSFESGICGISLIGPGISGTVSNCDFKDNEWAGLECGMVGPELSISFCSFDGNGSAVMMHNNSFPILSGFSVTANHTWFNGIFVEGSEWNVGGTITDAGCPYVLTGDWTFTQGVTVTFDAGVVVKLDRAGITAQNIQVNGTSMKPVTFTSLSDDDIYGDTNSNGPSEGATGDWNGIIVSSSPNSYINYARIMYANTSVFLDNSSCNFNGLYLKNDTQGLFFGNGSTGIVKNSDILGTEIAVYIDQTSVAVLGNLNDSDPENNGLNQFVCNNIAVANDNNLTIFAENNWWGTNPPNPSIFKGLVDYSPYLTAEIPNRNLISALKLNIEYSTNIHFRWDDLGLSCGYRVFKSDKPNEGFVDISGPLSGNEFSESNGGSEPGLFFYKVDIE